MAQHGSAAMTGLPHLAAVVLNYNTAEQTLAAVASLQASQRPVTRILVVDNGSGDGSVPVLRQQLPGVELLCTGRNLGFAGGCNVGIEAALAGGADLVLLLNPDATVHAATISQLEHGLATWPQAAIAGPVVLEADRPRTISSAGISFSAATGRLRLLGHGDPYDPAAPPPTRQVAAVSGCAMLLQRRVLRTVGLLVEHYFFSFEEVDLCLRAAAHGLQTLLVGEAVVHHQGSASIGPRSPLRCYYAARNHQLLAQRLAPRRGPQGLVRTLLICSYNLAHALRQPPRMANLAAALQGTWHWFRHRTGSHPQQDRAR